MERRRALKLTVSLAVLLAASTVGTASADDSAEAAKRSAEGKKLYDNSRLVSDATARTTLYKAAQDKFREAYELDPLPKYLFSYAQMARFRDDCPTALGAYKRFEELEKAKKTDRNTAALRITADYIDKLSEECEPSKEFAAPEVTAPNDIKEGDEEGDEEGDIDEPIDSSEVDKGPPSSRRNLYMGLAIGAGVVAALAGGYAVYEQSRLASGGHFDDAFQDARAMDPYMDSPGVMNACDDPQITPTPKSVCDDADAASSRATIAVITGAVATTAAVTMIVLMLREKPAKSEPVVGSGPGDVGVSVRLSF